MKKFAILTLILIALTACTAGSTPSLSGTWKLVSYGPAEAQVSAVPDVDTSIEFKDGQISANVGCNGIGGEYTVDGNQVTFDKVLSTMMFCEGPVGEQELSTLAVFGGKASVEVDGNTLTITSADGATAIVLAKK
jgi:heat shock protein HslJ